jgi:hypothetical protein
VCERLREAQYGATQEQKQTQNHRHLNSTHLISLLFHLFFSILNPRINLAEPYTARHVISPSFLIGTDSVHLTSQTRRADADTGTLLPPVHRASTLPLNDLSVRPQCCHLLYDLHLCPSSFPLFFSLFLFLLLAHFALSAHFIDFIHIGGELVPERGGRADGTPQVTRRLADAALDSC